ncbi:MAG TPA: hypothetical protein VF020_02525 [Chthoniobacterales bacterium]
MTVLRCAGIGIAALACASAIAQEPPGSAKRVTFDLVRSPGLASFPSVAPKAHGTVTVHSIGTVEIMKVKVEGLPPNTDFDLFVIQVPNAPFGLSWYQGDIETDADGRGSGEFVGRFSIETFIVAPGIAPAPADPFNEPGSIPDATQNPATNPVQTYHIGLWFNSPADVVKAGGPNITTPFNGEHNAGVQVLNTSEFPATSGPLEQVK